MCKSESEIGFREPSLGDWVPKEPLTIARHFNAGQNAEIDSPVPEGRLTPGRSIGGLEIKGSQVSRPGGTLRIALNTRR